jgi:hypothetical protein
MISQPGWCMSMWWYRQSRMPWFAKRTYVVETEGVDDGKDEEAWRGWQFAGGVVCADQF